MKKSNKNFASKETSNLQETVTIEAPKVENLEAKKTIVINSEKFLIGAAKRKTRLINSDGVKLSDIDGLTDLIDTKRRSNLKSEVTKETIEARLTLAALISSKASKANPVKGSDIVTLVEKLRSKLGLISNDANKLTRVKRCLNLTVADAKIGLENSNGKLTQSCYYNLNFLYPSVTIKIVEGPNWLTSSYYLLKPVDLAKLKVRQ